MNQTAMHSKNRFTVALVQDAPIFLNLDATVARAVDLVAEAASNGARVVVFGETWLPGYPVWIDAAPRAAIWDHPGAKALYRLLSRNSLEIPSPHFDRLRAAAGEAGVVVVIGAHEHRGGTLYNTVVTFAANGEDYVLHRKLTPTYTERLVWGQGDGSTLTALETQEGVIGSLVCWEHWMPLARAAMHAKRETLHIAQWPWVRELHQVCSRQYAFEGQCFVAASGCVMTKGQVLAGFDSLQEAANEGEARAMLESIEGEDDTLLLRGGSCLIAPDISFVAGPAFAEDGHAASAETIVYGDVDPALIDEGRMYLDSDGHYSRPDVFRLEVNTRALSNVVDV